MITIKAGTKTLELFGSIKELPISRYKLLQQYLLQDSGIGSTVNDFDIHFGKVITLLQTKNNDDAVEELSNMRYNFFTTISGLDFKCMAFACLVNKVGKQPVTDLSPSGLTAIVELLANTSNEELRDHWDGIKKKLIPNLAPTSPDGLEMTLSTLTT